MKRVVLAPDSFKGTLSSETVCALISGVLRARYPDVTVDEIPIADGGEGTVDAYLHIFGGEKKTVRAKSPLGRDIDASYAILPDGAAVIETAAASGIAIEPVNDAMRASTFGTGQLIKDALDKGCRKIFFGLGGSATTDGGVGCATALGARFLDKDGKAIPPGGAGLALLDRVDLSGLDARLRMTALTVLCDVTNPLFGKTGAAHVFAGQKGASDAQIETLDCGLQKLAAVCEPVLGSDFSRVPGAGAAGGLGFCAVALLGGRMVGGIDCILDAAQFAEKARDAVLVITGEGKMDAQSLMGKAPFGVAKRSGKTPVLAVVGLLDAEMAQVERAGICRVIETNARHLPFEEIRDRAKEDLIFAAKKINLEEFY